MIYLQLQSLGGSRTCCREGLRRVEKGCSHCLKSFPTEKFGEKRDYSGFDRSIWPVRSLDDHKKHGMSWKHAHTFSKWKEIEVKFGVRYTELICLP